MKKKLRNQDNKAKTNLNKANLLQNWNIKLLTQFIWNCYSNSNEFKSKDFFNIWLTQFSTKSWFSCMPFSLSPSVFLSGLIEIIEIILTNKISAYDLNCLPTNLHALSSSRATFRVCILIQKLNGNDDDENLMAFVYCFIQYDLQYSILMWTVFVRKISKRSKKKISIYKRLPINFYLLNIWKGDIYCKRLVLCKSNGTHTHRKKEDRRNNHRQSQNLKVYVNHCYPFFCHFWLTFCACVRTVAFPFFSLEISWICHTRHIKFKYNANKWIVWVRCAEL